MADGGRGWAVPVDTLHRRRHRPAQHGSQPTFPTPEGMATIIAEYTPRATPAFQITGPNSKVARETRDRIRAAVNSGLEWEPGLVQLVAHWTVVRTGSSSDLALACTALAAVGIIDPATLNGVAMIGQLGLDGRVLWCPRDVTDTVRVAQEAGLRKFIVAPDDFDKVSENIDITPVGANDLTAARAFLFEMHEPETTSPAARPCPSRSSYHQRGTESAYWPGGGAVVPPPPPPTCAAKDRPKRADRAPVPSNVPIWPRRAALRSRCWWLPGNGQRTSPEER